MGVLGLKQRVSSRTLTALAFPLMSQQNAIKEVPDEEALLESPSLGIISRSAAAAAAAAALLSGGRSGGSAGGSPRKSVAGGSDRRSSEGSSGRASSESSSGRADSGRANSGRGESSLAAWAREAMGPPAATAPPAATEPPTEGGLRAWFGRG